MLSPTKVEEVRTLLAAGEISHRAIARATGVSRGTVDGIASGRRREPQPRKMEDRSSLFGGPIVRCPGCGGKVFAPCVLCRVRNVVDERTVPSAADDRRRAASFFSGRTAR